MFTYIMHNLCRLCEISDCVIVCYILNWLKLKKINYEENSNHLYSLSWPMVWVKWFALQFYKPLVVCCHLDSDKVHLNVRPHKHRKLGHYGNIQYHDFPYLMPNRLMLPANMLPPKILLITDSENVFLKYFLISINFTNRT